MMPLSAPPYVRVAFAIRERYNAGESLAELAVDYDLPVLTVDAIVRARTAEQAGEALRLHWAKETP